MKRFRAAAKWSVVAASISLFIGGTVVAASGSNSVTPGIVCGPGPDCSWGTTTTTTAPPATTTTTAPPATTTTTAPPPTTTTTAPPAVLSPTWIQEAAQASGTAVGTWGTPISSQSVSGGESLNEVCATCLGSQLWAFQGPSTATNATNVTSPSSISSRNSVVALVPPLASSDSLATTVNGSVTYADGASNFGTSITPFTNGTIESSLVLAGGTSPTSYTYNFTSTGATLYLQSNGSVLIQNTSGQVLGSIGIPHATNSSGQALASSFTVSGSTLTQNVSLGSSPTFPVTLDALVTVGFGNWNLIVSASQASAMNSTYTNEQSAGVTNLKAIASLVCQAYASGSASIGHACEEAVAHYGSAFFTQIVANAVASSEGFEVSYYWVTDFPFAFQLGNF